VSISSAFRPSRLPFRRNPLALAVLIALGTLGSTHSPAATRAWVGPGLFWDTNGNWLGSLPPGALDDAALGAFNTEVRTNFSILSFAGTGLLTSSAATLSFSNASSIGALALTGGTLVGVGPLAIASVSGAATFSGGSMLGTGRTSVAGLTTISGGGIGLDNGYTLEIKGNANWTAGTINLNAVNNNFSGALQNVQGIVLNAVGSTFTNSFDGSIASPNYGGGDAGTTALFDNRGTFTKSGGAGTTSIASIFSNSGTVNVNSGTLSLNGGGTHTGATFGGTGTLNFGGGTHTVDAASTITVTNLGFSGGTANIAGNLTITGTTTINGGTANIGGIFAGGPLVVSSGAMNLNAAGSASTLAQSGGTIGGSNTLSVAGAATFSGGSMLGTGRTSVAGLTTISGSGVALDNGYTLETKGGANWTAGTIQLNAVNNNFSAALQNVQGIVLNAVGSTFTNSFDGSIASPNYGGGDAGTTALFDNRGTFTKSGGAGTTTVSVNFVNAATGTVDVQAGTLALSAGGSNAGALNVGASTTLLFSGGTFDLGGSATGSATGRLRVDGATVNNTNGKTFGGLLEVASGTFNANSALTTARYAQTGGTLGGGNTLSVAGTAALSGGSMLGIGKTSVTGLTTISGSGIALDNGYTLEIKGNANWTAGAIQLNAVNNNFSGALQNVQGTVVNAVGSTFTNSFDGSVLSPNYNGGDAGTTALFDNRGTFIKSGGAGTTNIGSIFSNSGTLSATVGTLSINGSLSNFSGSTLTGGNYEVFGPSTLQFAGANVVTNAATILLDGAGSNFLNSSTATSALANFATNAAAGSFTIRNGRNFTTLGNFGNSGIVNVGSGSTFTTAGAGAFTNQPSGTLQMAGGSFVASTLANAGTVSGFGTVTPAISDSGLVRAAGGTLAANGGVLGATGNVTIDAGATLSLASAALASTARVLTQGGSLNLGAQNITVFKDYSNVGFGSGNSFAARAGVSGAGVIVGQNAAQTLTGQVVAGAANTFTVDFGNVRGGTAATRTFQIANSGSGADIRGALQTGGPGLGNLSDARLSGSGSVAANFGPILAGANGGDLSITLNSGSTGGALSGQSFAVVSNFSNVATQTGGLSGFTTVLAQGSAAPAGPLNLGNFRVGVPPAVSTNLAVTNTTTGAGAEQLGIGSASATGNFSASNNLGAALVAAGTTAANAVTVASAGGTTGLNSGDVTLQFVTNGQIFDASFANLATNQQTLAVQATGFLQAQPALPANVSVGNYRLTTGASSAFTLTNTNLAPAGFQEVLNATPGSTTAGVTLLGNISGLAAGASSSNLVIGFAAGGSAGARSGSADVTLVSDGTGTSGLGLLALSKGVVGITGTAFNVAVGAATPSPVLVGNQRLNGVGGGSANVALNVANTAAAGSFSEALNASFSGFGGQATTNSGSFANLAAGSSNTTAMVVSVDNTQVGNRTGSVTLAYQTDGTGSNGNSGLAAVGAGTQVINVSGNVYRLASASAATPSPVVLANQRVGGTLSQVLSLSNTAAGDGFSEGLNATIAASGTATGAGSFSLLAAGANSNALSVGVNTVTAGAKSGVATITLASDGTAVGNSGFGAFGIGTQTVNVSGNVYRLATASAATPSPVVLANQRVGGTLSQVLSLSNTAAGDGFSEGLNATIAASGTATGAGSFSLLAAGANSNALSVGVNTVTAGAKSGVATITLASDGTAVGNSGFGASGIGTQTVNVSGNVYRLATASAATPSPVVLANQRLGGTLSQVITLNNTAAADSFSEGLNATIAANGTATAAGSFSLLAAGGSSNALSVGVNTVTAGAKSGVATLTLASDGSGTSGFAAFGIGTQTVNVSGNVYRLATASAVAPAALVFANVREGGSNLQSLSLVNTAVADGFSEGLNAGITATSGFTASGSFSLLAAGASSSALGVSMDTGTAGGKSGTATITLASDGSAAGNSGFGAFGIGTQVVNLSGGVFRLASASAATPNPVVLANQRVGDALSQLITIGNTAVADGFSESLNATIAANGTATAAGSFSLLAAGADSSALSVGVNTASAGAKSGVATITLASDGSGTSGFAAFGIGTQTVNVSGNVFRLATASAATPSPVVLASQRIGGILSQAITVGNTAMADGFSERLNASIAASGTATAAGSFSLLAAGDSSSALIVSVNTATAGAKSGVATVTLASDGSGTSGFGAAAIGTQQVNVSGNVYAPAQASAVPGVAFGIVHVGEVVAARNIPFTNSAAPAGLNDSLVASVSGGSAHFATAGNGSALAGQTNNTSIQVTLNTANAGVFDSSAALALLSRNPDMTDLGLGSVNVPLSATVNNFALAALAQSGGAGSFSQSQANVYTLDFGSVVEGTGGLNAALSVLNAANGPADLLRGSFNVASVGPGFTLSGFDAFSGLAAGASQGGLSVGFDNTIIGTYSTVILLSAFGINASGFDGALANVELRLQGSVVAIPEPGTYALMLGGLLLLARAVRRRQAELA